MDAINAMKVNLCMMEVPTEDDTFFFIPRPQQRQPFILKYGQLFPCVFLIFLFYLIKIKFCLNVKYME